MRKCLIRLYAGAFSFTFLCFLAMLLAGCSSKDDEQATEQTAEKVAEPKDGTYLVIDLSGGPKASKYPYRYSETGPDVNGDACRTTELWLRKIPAGTFRMGSPEDERGRTNKEKLHRVTLSQSYYMGVFEVTQKQWELVMGRNPSHFKGDTRPVENVSYDDIRGKEDGAGWPAHGHKVDATSFPGRLQSKTGLTLDLPTEAQWEYACRAGTTTGLNSGKNITSKYRRCPNLDEVGRYSFNLDDGKGGYGECHTRVGSYRPNAWGLYDMHGNVFEWCLDWYIAYEGDTTDPKGASKGYARGDDRVCRGGSWYNDAGECRSACRNHGDPAFRFVSLGFRLALCDVQ